ncbi:MAG: TetR/AcrR family transcriptional regulator, partial [Paraprevotella clara]|nr:TetR/AcrR family transcriptional regulator [Paraprevotella clara]
MSKKDNTEQAILQAAETEFLDKGFALAKTTEIAKQAGVTHAMYNPQIQISVVSGTKRSIFRQKNKTKRSK